MPMAKLTSKGQLTLPKQVREHLGLSAGDKVEFRLEDQGSARVLPATRKALDLLGILSPPGKRIPLSVAQMDENLRAAFRKEPR